MGQNVQIQPVDDLSPGVKEAYLSLSKGATLYVHEARTEEDQRAVALVQRELGNSVKIIPLGGSPLPLPMLRADHTEYTGIAEVNRYVTILHYLRRSVKY
jgi:hypothetical protein